MQRKQAFVGRQPQLDALDAARRQASDGGRFALVTGATGSGRTAVLDAVGDAWRAAGAAVLRVSAPPTGDPVTGYAALLDLLREQYGQIDSPSLAGPLSAIDALCGPAGANVPGRSAALAQQTSAAFGLIGLRRPTVLIADDVDDVPWLTPALAAAVRDNCLVVAASRAGSTGRATALADVVTELTPLDAVAVHELLTRRYGVPVDDAVLPALSAALGPLAGNPATALQTADALIRAGRLVVVGGHLCLLEPQAPLPLPADHPLMSAVRRRGPGAVRLATMAAVTRFDLDAVPLFADAMLGCVDGYGRLVDGLVADGVLVAEPDGVLRPSCPAVAARLVADAGADAVTRLHRAYAAAMLRRSGSGVPADRAALADHVTSAGATLPTDRRTALALVATASEAMDREPLRAADWLDAALRHCADGPAGEDILANLLRLLVRTGQVGRLAEVVRAVPVGDHPDLAAARTLAALHCDVGIPTGPGPGRQAQLVTDVEFALVGWACGVGTGRPSTGGVRLSSGDVSSSTKDVPRMDGEVDAGRLLVAGATGDLAHVLELVLGDGRYRAPADGPLAAYHRMLICRARGDLAGTVSAARQVGLTGGRAPVARRLARLWGAESLALQGRADEAAAWLASVPDEAPFAALRWWVANGPASGPADADEACLRLGSAMLAYRRQLRSGSRIGVDRLLKRAAGMAARFGLPHWSAETRGIALDGGTLLVVRAAASSDPAVGAEAVAAIRARCDRVELAYAALDLGWVFDDPRRLLVEALDTAEEIGSPSLREAVVAAMRARGVRRRKGSRPRTTLNTVEMQIIDLIRRGHTNRQIAVGIRMSEKTVENYLTRLFVRTGCRSRVELAAASLTSGALDLTSGTLDLAS